MSCPRWDERFLALNALCALCLSGDFGKWLCTACTAKVASKMSCVCAAAAGLEPCICHWPCS